MPLPRAFLSLNPVLAAAGYEGLAEEQREGVPAHQGNEGLYLKGRREPRVRSGAVDKKRSLFRKAGDAAGAASEGNGRTFRTGRTVVPPKARELWRRGRVCRQGRHTPAHMAERHQAMRKGRPLRKNGRLREYRRPCLLI